MDCWLHTESMDSDLNRCLERFEHQGGHVRGRVEGRAAQGASRHGTCGLFFDKETEALVKELDGPLFAKPLKRK